jgi:hypothetical protein
MAVEPPLMVSLSSGDAEIPLGDQQDASLAGGVQDGGELHNGIRSRDRRGPEPGPRDQAVPPGEAAACDEQGGSERPGQADRGRDDSHVPKRGRHADLHLAVQSYSL